MIVVVDTDALLGLFDPKDSQLEKADRVAGLLVEKGAEFMIAPTTLGEFALLASSRIGVEKTKDALQRIKEMSYGVVEISADFVGEALALYDRQTSKEESLFDCYVMAAARKVGADCIFSFDKGYKKNGFKLAEDVV